MQYKIKFFSNFCDSKHLKNVFEDICQVSKMENYGEDKDIWITTADDYSHVIILNSAMPILTIPKSNVVGLAYEPPQFNQLLGLTYQFIDYAQKHIGKYFTGNKHTLPDPFIENFAYMSYITPLQYIPLKTKHMSIMVSQKNIAPGHKYRHQIVQQILKTNLPIDIYGRGAVFYNNLNDSRVKGVFNEYEPYESYDFHICIENFQTNCYISEKLMNPLLCGTTPIYWGASHAGKYVYDERLISLSGNITEDMQLIENICKSPEKYKQKIDPVEIHDKINILKHLDILFTSDIL